jgi:hypothetical protein
MIFLPLVLNLTMAMSISASSARLIGFRTLLPRWIREKRIKPRDVCGT